MDNNSSNIYEMKQPTNFNSKKISKSFFVIFLAIIILIMLSSSFTIVEAGNRGVLLQLGAVQSTVFSEGLHFKIPFIQSVVQVDIRVQKAESEESAASKDLQTVSTRVAVNYHLNEQTVNKLYQSVGLNYEDKIIKPAISEALKSITAKYTAEELVSKRSEVSMAVKENLTKKLAQYNMILDEINITEFKFSEEYNKAIEQKQIAEQQALKAKLDLQRIEIEAKQKIEQAKAEAESLRLQKQEVTPELIQLREIEAKIKAIEKWDGKLPSTTGGAIPFIDVGK